MNKSQSLRQKQFSYPSPNHLPPNKRPIRCSSKQILTPHYSTKGSTVVPSANQNILVPRRQPHRTILTTTVIPNSTRKMGQHITRQQQQKQTQTASVGSCCPPTTIQRPKRPRPTSLVAEASLTVTGVTTSSHRTTTDTVATPLKNKANMNHTIVGPFSNKASSSNKMVKQKTYSPHPKVTCRRPLSRHFNNNSHSKKIITHIPKSQMATKNNSYAADIITSSSSMSYRSNNTKSAIVTRSTTQRHSNNKYFQQPKRACFQNISLKARVYTPLSILRSQILGGDHLGSLCEPVTETIIIRRDANSLEKWLTLKDTPSYFQRAEVNTNISCAQNSNYSFIRRVANFALIKPIQRVIERYSEIHTNCELAITKSYTLTPNQTRGYKLPDNMWPVGYDGGCDKPTMCVDISPFKTYRNYCTTHLDLLYLARDVFKLSQESYERIMKKETTLLFEVSWCCKQWCNNRKGVSRPPHVPEAYFPYTVFITPSERFLEVKLGVYYMLDTGRVIKFMTRPECLTEFVLESLFGFGIQGNLKGAVGVLSVCPEGFCLEMEFAGMALQDVLNGDLNCNLNGPVPPHNQNQHLRIDKPEMIQHHMAPSKLKGILYNVRMLQVTGNLPDELKKKCTLHITDSHAAVGVANLMRDRFLNQLPFALTEIINIVTRLSQQGLVNPDIKADNIVIDGSTGQPKMIDFGLLLPADYCDKVKRRNNPYPENVYNLYPQTAPEYLQGRMCNEAAMTYGLSYLISFVIATLSSRTTDFAVGSMKTNIKLSFLLGLAYDKCASKRPKPYILTKAIAGCFPLQEKIMKLFLNPKHFMK
uniref:Wsv423-like protein n=1 Tax=Pasiphaea japonica whispovirus TaxID=2984286 RepID=A0A9C7BXG4_9VIRU|nr:MAG: wsv423-like protein [Pasiphaea japonica whispovirus]